MKQTYIWVAFTLLLILNIILMMRLSHANKRIDSMANSRNEAPHKGGNHQGHNEEEEIEVAVVMSHIQRHTNKLFFAGKNANWPLASFYVHELEESMEEIEDGNIEDDGINISKLMKAMGIPALEGLEDAIKAEDTQAFDTAYQQLVTNCNACHQSTNHPYIVIINPTTPALDNQQF